MRLSKKTKWKIVTGYHTMKYMKSMKDQVFWDE